MSWRTSATAEVGRTITWCFQPITTDASQDLSIGELNGSLPRLHFSGWSDRDRTPLSFTRTPSHRLNKHVDTNCYHLPGSRTLVWFDILRCLRNKVNCGRPKLIQLPLALKSPYLHAWTNTPGLTQVWPVFWDKNVGGYTHWQGAKNFHNWGYILVELGMGGYDQNW